MAAGDSGPLLDRAAEAPSGGSGMLPRRCQFCVGCMRVEPLGSAPTPAGLGVLKTAHFLPMFRLPFWRTLLNVKSQESCFTYPGWPGGLRTHSNGRGIGSKGSRRLPGGFQCRGPRGCLPFPDRTQRPKPFFHRDRQT